MGIAETDFAHWAHLSPPIDWSGIYSICDLGQQELFTGAPGAMRSALAALAGPLGVPDADIDKLMAERWIRDIWKAFGRRITSIDVVGSGEDYLYLDLNSDTVPPEHRGRYDFVTNCGTTEHVMNQYNCFQIMHELARPGGYMYHSLPCSGLTNHGFFSYRPKFFSLLALANGYQFVDAFVTADPTLRPLDDESRAMMRQEKAFLSATIYGSAEHLVRDFQSTDAGIRVCLRKPLGDEPFKPPLDVRAENVDVYGGSTG